MIFISKMRRQLTPVADILAYCIMPNHFHVLLCPKHELIIDIPQNCEDVLPRLPTAELSEAVKRWLMGFTKSYNKFYSLTGSRFTQHSRCKYHLEAAAGIQYIHHNPVKAGLVSIPEEWGYSSWAEHAGFISNEEAICNLELVSKLSGR